MFHETIRTNLAYARPDATESELVDACRDAQIWDLVQALPEGLDTIVGDRGYRLSGGEKQRLAIARLLLKAPSVVILDEATAHLDSESEVAVQKALARALAGRTSLVIAHRLSTVRDADAILVVEDGRVVEHGRHEELLARGGLYADLYRTQFATPGARRAQPHCVTRSSAIVGLCHRLELPPCQQAPPDHGDADEQEPLDRVGQVRRLPPAAGVVLVGGEDHLRVRPPDAGVSWARSHEPAVGRPAGGGGDVGRHDALGLSRG